ncbi:MAG: STAS domain-containing protein [Pseudazoarcus pumilus]|nr:STAS domain-containing protein [Pseudazoarcus pumilus]
MSQSQQHVLKPTGALTMDSAAGHLRSGREMVASGDVLVDLSAISGFDSAALALLLDWMRESAARGGRLTLAAVPPGLASLAQLYGVDELLSPGEVTGKV